MGVRFPSVSSNVIQGSVPNNGLETILAITPPLNLPLDFAQVLLFWYVVQLVGAGSASVIIRIRRPATLTGTVVTVSTTTQSVTPAATVALSGSYGDTPGAVAGVQYALTCSAAGTTGVWTTEDVSLIALVL